MDMEQDGILPAELARRTGTSVARIRYLERIGLLEGVTRTAGGHRRYDEAHVRKLGFVLRACDLGFAPEDVRAILALGGPGRATCGEVRAIAARHLETVRAKIKDLAMLEDLLSFAIGRCTGEAVPECAVIDLLEHAA
jgi:MerR family mercuric resistance operon transcriptional regulator